MMSAGPYTEAIIKAKSTFIAPHDNEAGDLCIPGQPGLTLSRETLSRHIIVSGDVGSGWPRVFMHSLLHIFSGIRDGNGDIAIVLDPGREYLNRFYGPLHTTVFCPGDERSEHPSFDPRDWMRERLSDGLLTNRVLLLSYDQAAQNGAQYAGMIDAMFDEIERHQSAKRVWLIIPELEALEISSLRDIMVRGRKYGLVVIGHVESVRQLEHVYGMEGVEALEATSWTKIVFNPGDDFYSANHWSKKLDMSVETVMTLGVGEAFVLQTGVSKTTIGEINVV